MLRTVALSIVLLAGGLSQVGLAIHREPWPCGNTYYGCQCGCFYWHEWFSHKPCCCDPCNWCGQFTKSKNPYVVNGPRYTRFGEVYSDGSGSNAPGAIGELYNSPTPAQQPGQPTPATPGVMDDMGPNGGQPGPTTMSPRGRTAARERYESEPASRNMGRPPRTRLFTR